MASTSTKNDSRKNPVLGGEGSPTQDADHNTGRPASPNAGSDPAAFDRNPGALEKRLVHWPMGRFGTLEEAAGATAFFASDDSGFITAAALPLDGGITEAITVPE